MVFWTLETDTGLDFTHWCYEIVDFSSNFYCLISITIAIWWFLRHKVGNVFSSDNQSWASWCIIVSSTTELNLRFKEKHIFGRSCGSVIVMAPYSFLLIQHPISSSYLVSLLWIDDFRFFLRFSKYFFHNYFLCNSLDLSSYSVEI